MLATLLASPAQAKLDETILEFQRSPLIKGDRLFKFDGRIGARYRFSGATRCKFGNGLMFIDTEDGRIVQQTIVLPLPNTPRERQTIEAVAKLFLEDTGLAKEYTDVVWANFQEGIMAGKSQQKTLGPLNPLATHYDTNVYTNPSLHSIMIVVGLDK
jgi:hypothetical protein